MPGHPTDHAGLEILPFDECLRLLASVPVGRVGFFADGEIVVLPVNHLVDGQNPVFRTAHGSKLSTIEGHNLVAFEADDYDKQTRSGWSVVVSGRAEAVYEESEVQRLDRLGLHPWVTAVARPFWIRVRATSVSGRQTPAGGPAAHDPDSPSGTMTDRAADLPADRARIQRDSRVCPARVGAAPRAS